jgi:hypothetical protein
MSFNSFTLAPLSVRSANNTHTLSHSTLIHAPTSNFTAILLLTAGRSVNTIHTITK